MTLAVVVGRPASAGNEEVIAFVQPRAGAPRDVAALAAWAATRLAPYKRPSLIVFVDALPTTSTGKLQKHVLRTRALTLDAAPARAS